MDNFWILVAGSIIIPALSVIGAFWSSKKGMDWRVKMMEENHLRHLEDRMNLRIDNVMTWIGRVEKKLDDFIMKQPTEASPECRVRSHTCGTRTLRKMG